MSPNTEKDILLSFYAHTRCNLCSGRCVGPALSSLAPLRFFTPPRTPLPAAKNISRARSKINMERPPPLLLAILQGDTEALRTLLESGFTSEQLNKPYRMVCEVQRVCQRGEMMTPLALAAGWGKASCVKLLLEARASPSARRAPSDREHYKMVPLHWACGSQSVDCAMLLLDAPGGAATLGVRVRVRVGYPYP